MTWKGTNSFPEFALLKENKSLQFKLFTCMDTDLKKPTFSSDLKALM